MSIRDYALVAEQVDAADLKSVGSNPVPVRFRPSAPIKKHPQGCFLFQGKLAGSEPEVRSGKLVKTNIEF